MLWGVVGLPVLLPIVALLQLLFPGLLRDQWRQYRYAVQVLLTQSTLIFTQWALVKWVFKLRPWWLSDDALAAALVAVALLGIVRAWFNRRALQSAEPDASGAKVAAKGPAGVEFGAGSDAPGWAGLGRILALDRRIPLGSDDRGQFGRPGRIVALGLSGAPGPQRRFAAALEHGTGVRRCLGDGGDRHRHLCPAD